MIRTLDATLGRLVRHLLFLLVRFYYAVFYNVSASGKHLITEHPGAIVLATHVSRNDGPLLLSALYTCARMRPVVHYDEYHSALQWLPMFVISAIPVSSPRRWAAERRAAWKDRQMRVIGKVLAAGNTVLLFPAGVSRQQPEEVVKPHFSGAYDMIRAHPNAPVLLARIEGLGRFQTPRFDAFWTFIGRAKGRRHVAVEITRLEGLSTDQPMAAFNAQLEALLNRPIDMAPTSTPE
ncbi:MAG: 1-acyl-sn-glycerol-3-phosphate acyltransferase [Pseudomonadota bacterium]